MNFRLLFYLLRYLRKSGIWCPFKVYNASSIKVRKSSKLNLSGRLSFGSSDRNKAVVSVNKTNFYIGHHSNVNIGHSVSIGPGVNIIVKDNGKLEIGNGTYFTSDLHLEVHGNTWIGSDCAISWGVTIIDSDHHVLNYPNQKSKSDSVIIGNHVWIGNNSIILKGSKIGDGCVIAAGSVVTGEFPSGVLIGGCPAKVIKENVEWH